ncbi:kinase [Psychromonas marina]|uniref:Kinase n=1 Tax=Psychromonas marina TaxID=88364 RepID=A0ABQ6DZW3_9GAMM|nr:P-loop NTPase fold protein [Psychromonas marina]GLS90716.1 kinase [Psychromonas marina]
MFKSFINKHQLTEDFIYVAKANFVPLAEKIMGQRQSQSKGPFFVGINGCQGSGKSTLSEFLHDYIRHNSQLNVIVLSLDDFYFSQQTRLELAANIHPLLKTRGVPGTHDTKHIQQVFSQLKQADSNIVLPRFNKATGNPYPSDEWPEAIQPVDIVIFEGWCWGVQAQSEEQLVEPVNSLEKQFDTDANWRTYVNHKLLNDYQPLYAQIDFWVLLKAPSFNSVYQWRLEQEQKLLLSAQGDNRSGIMSEQQVLQFIQYYQRLTEHCLATLPASCDVVFHLNNDRKIEKIVSK